MIPTNGGRTSVRIGGNGPPLVLVHGLQVGQELFDALRDYLERTFTVITYDQRDKGATEFAEHAYTMADLADDLAALISALGFERAHVAGTSYGGMVAQMLAVRHRALIDRLVLASTGQHPLGPGRVRPEARKLLEDVEGGDASAARALPSRFAAPKAAVSAPIVAASVGDAALVSEGLARRLAAMKGFDTRGLLKEMDAPTLVLHGREDPVLGIEDSVAMAHELPRATLLVLDGVGHTWENEDPQRAAEFLTVFLGARP